MKSYFIKRDSRMGSTPGFCWQTNENAQFAATPLTPADIFEIKVLFSIQHGLPPHTGYPALPAGLASR